MKESKLYIRIALILIAVYLIIVGGNGLLFGMQGLFHDGILHYWLLTLLSAFSLGSGLILIYKPKIGAKMAIAYLIIQSIKIYSPWIVFYHICSYQYLLNLQTTKTTLVNELYTILWFGVDLNATAISIDLISSALIITLLIVKKRL